MPNTVEIIITARDSASRALKGIGTSLSKLTKVVQLATLAFVAVGSLSVKAFADFESAFAGVRKTVDASEGEFKILSDAIRNMAKEIPASTVEISRVAEAAGQLGIQKENILDFTRTMIDLGNSTNLSSEIAATSLARLANITQMSQDNFSNLGSAVVALGNNFATTEAEIVDMALNIAGAGKQIGLTEAEILSFSTALSSVGIRAERGGTAFQRVMIEIAKAVKKGGNDLREFAKVAGESSEDFKTSFQDDAAGALVNFVEGLDRISKSGKNTFKVLEDLGFANIRVQDTLLRASGAGQLMRDALQEGSSAWTENVALTTEAEKRYATLTSQLKMFWSRIKDVGITIGAELAPAVVEVSQLLGNFADKAGEIFQLLPQIVALSVDTMKDLFYKFFNDYSFFEALLTNAGILAVELLQGFGNMLIELSNLALKWGMVIFSPLGVGATFIWEQVKFGFANLLQDMAKTANKILPEAFQFNYADKIILPAKTFKELWEKNGKDVGIIIDSMGENFASIGDGFSATFATLKGAIGEIADSPEIQALLEEIDKLFEGLEKGLAGIPPQLDSHIKAFREANKQIREDGIDTAEAVKTAWEGFFGEMLSNLEMFQEVSQVVWNAFRTGVGDAIGEAIIYGKDLAKSLQNVMQSIVASLISGLVQIGIERLAQSVLAHLLNLKEASSRMAVLGAETYAGAYAAVVGTPGVGPAIAPGIAAASTALMLAGATASASTSGALGATIAGIAHGGLENVPADSTFLLKKGERVLSPSQNKDLERFMSGGGGGGRNSG